MIDTLYRKALDAAVKNDAGEDIVYRQKGKADVQLKAIPEYGVVDITEKDKIEDRLIFHGLTLDFEPKIGDTVIYSGKTYAVESHKGIYGRYDVTTVIRRHRR